MFIHRELHIAIVSELPEAVIALLQMCPHPALLDIYNDSRQTPLHLAVLTRQHLMARRLLLAGAKVSIYRVRWMESMRVFPCFGSIDSTF